MYATGLTAEWAVDRDRSARMGPNWKLLALAGAIAFALCASASAAAPEVQRIEEDWEVVIGTPSPDGHTPQIINAMSTTNRLEDVHALFELNHKTQPSFVPGYLQLQCWSGDTLLGYGTSGKTGLLKTTGETIRYTIRMSLGGGNVEFDVRNGNSTTWGTFGSQGYLRIRIPTTQTYFPLYSPDVSTANSRIAYASHRVQRFALKQVRYYSAGGTLLLTDNTERVVHDLSTSGTSTSP